VARKAAADVGLIRSGCSVGTSFLFTCRHCLFDRSFRDRSGLAMSRTSEIPFFTNDLAVVQALMIFIDLVCSGLGRPNCNPNV
jgi:hypothetical protein